jgi:hypothetical protein
MPATDTTPTRSPRAKQSLALVEAAGADRTASDDASPHSMAVSIAGVSTACSKDALVSSARAVRKTLAPE